MLGDAPSVDDAVRLVLDAEPDVVLLDVQMPGGGGVEVIRQVAVRRPAQRFLALSVSRRRRRTSSPSSARARAAT